MALLLLISAPAYADLEKNHFRLGALAFLPRTAGDPNSYSAIPSWEPVLRYGWLSLKARFGAAVLRDSGGSNFLMADTEGGFLLSPTEWLDLELLGGAETWVNAVGTSPEATAILSTGLPWPGTGIFAGYSAVFLTGGYSHQLTAGVEFPL